MGDNCPTSLSATTNLKIWSSRKWCGGVVLRNWCRIYIVAVYCFTNGDCLKKSHESGDSSSSDVTELLIRTTTSKIGVSGGLELEYAPVNKGETELDSRFRTGGLLDQGAQAVLDRFVWKGTLVDEGQDAPQDKTFFGEDENGNPIVVGSWFNYGSYTLAVCIFGTAFLIGCAATAVYYVIFVVTDPAQSRSARKMSSSVGNITSFREKLEMTIRILDALDAVLLKITNFAE